MRSRGRGALVEWIEARIQMRQAVPLDETLSLLRRWHRWLTLELEVIVV